MDRPGDRPARAGEPRLDATHGDIVTPRSAATGAALRPCVAAGLRVRCRSPLPGLEDDGWADGEVTVRFGAAAPRPGRWLALPRQCGGGVVAADGRELRLPEAASGRSGRAAAVRQAVPFAAILQGRITLHAAAVACPGGVAAFTGPSGSGKSTLAAALERSGVTVCADDLLPCREADGGCVGPARRPGGPWTLAPLTRVFFLAPRGDAPGVRCTPMGRSDAVVALVRNGFGELPVADVWRRQFHLYAELAEHVEAFELRLPDGLERLAAAAGEVADLLGPGAAA